jgi:hypothetical protein
MLTGSCPCCGGTVRYQELEGPAWTFADLVRRDPLIAKRLEVDAESGCWIWTGARQKSGSKQTALYGRLSRRGIRWLVHRWVHHVMIGPIPPDYDVHHKVEEGCTNTLCCNPRHLEAVPHGAEHEWIHREMASYEEAAEAA